MVSMTCVTAFIGKAENVYCNLVYCLVVHPTLRLLSIFLDYPTIVTLSTLVSADYDSESVRK